VIGPPVLGEATCHDELVDVLRARQIALKLSNETLDHIALLSQGHVDKLLGPSRQRGLSRISFDALLSSLALKLVVIEDEKQSACMKARWEARNPGCVSTTVS
jgi:hypothetical protein